MYPSTKLNQFPSTRLCTRLCRQPRFFRSAALENYFRRSCSARFPSIHHLAVSLPREVGATSTLNQPFRFPSISPSCLCCASQCLLESPSKLKSLECTTDNSWNALEKATGHRIALLPLCLSVHMNIHRSDSSFDKSKCDEREGCKDSTF